MGKASRKKQKSLTKKSAGVSVESSPFGRYATAVASILIAITALLIYSNTFDSPFHFDDKHNIVENYKLTDLTYFWPPSGTRYIGFLSFALNYHLGGLDVFGYHLVNNAVHIINGLLLFLLVLMTLKTPVMGRASGDAQLKYFIALASALLFVSHPVQTQAVTYITQRFASLATVFYLLSLTLFVKWRLSGATLSPRLRTVIYAASVLSAVLAMKTKEISFTLPFIIVLYDFAFFDDKTLKEQLLSFTPFVLTLAIIPLSLFAPELGPGEATSGIAETVREKQLEELATISPYYYLVTQFRVIVTYIRLLFVPINQNLDYDYPHYISIFEPEVLFSFLFLLSIMGLAVYLFIRSRKTNNGYGLLASFGILWFFITLSIESSIIPIQDVIYEHRLYLPSVGAVIAFTAFVFYAKERLGIKVSALVFTCALLLVTAVSLGLAAYSRNLVWNDEVTLWQDVVSKSPNKARGYSNLGLAYDKLGRIDEAIEEYETAIRLNPHLTQAHDNLGNAYYSQGRIEEAIRAYKKALRAKPGNAAAHNNLGTIYHERGETDKAIDEYKEAIRLKPDFPDVHYNLGNAYSELGQTDEAIEEYKEALKLKPDSAKAHNNLGLAYYRQGRMDEAIGEYKEAIRLNPSHAKAHFNLGLAYKQKGLKNQAISAFEEGLKIKPDDVTARNILESLTTK